MKSSFVLSNKVQKPSCIYFFAGWHLHDFKWRRVRLPDVDADSEPAAIRHSGHAQDPGTPGRG